MTGGSTPKRLVQRTVAEVNYVGAFLELREDGMRCPQCSNPMTSREKLFIVFKTSGSFTSLAAPMVIQEEDDANRNRRHVN